MKNQFVPYPIALALKELGFDEPCVAFYKGETLLSEFILDNSRTVFYTQIADTIINSNEISAPLWQQVEEWFREKHHLFINVLGDSLNGTLKGFYYSITEHGWLNWYESVDDGKWYGTYQEAREAAVLEAIKLLKEENK